jgi:hypothetical protein
MRPAWIAALGLLAVACQEYEFQPLNPVTFRQTVQSKKVVAKQFKPNLMLVIDRSDSMKFPIVSGGEPRLTAMKRAMDTYLKTYGTVARMGLMAFPADFACGAGKIESELWTTNDVPADLQTHANEINSKIQALTNQGATPSGETLKLLATYAPMLSGRENVAVLVTDGLPNCNPNNPNSYDADPNACDCTFAAAQCGGTYTRLSCLDQAGTVTVVKDLLSKGIKTAVVAIGDDALTGTGPNTMNAIASEGGAPRSCPNGTDAECGATPCNKTTKVCDQRYYAASSEADLAAALATIGYDLSKTEGCKFQLDVAPEDPSYISVVVNKESIASGSTTWTYDAASQSITFTGAICQKLANSTPDDPVNVEFRVLDTL